MTGLSELGGGGGEAGGSIAPPPPTRGADYAPPRILRPSYGPVTCFMFVPLTQSASEIIIYFQNGRTLRSIPIFANKMSSWSPWVLYKKSLPKFVLKKSEFKFSPNFLATRYLFRNLQPGLSKVSYLAPLTLRIFLWIHF